MKQKQILMTKHMLCLCCVVMWWARAAYYTQRALLTSDTEREPKSARNTQCAHLKLCRATMKQTKMLSAKINKTNRNEKLSTTRRCCVVVTVAFNFNSTQCDTTLAVPTHTHAHAHTHTQPYMYIYRLNFTHVWINTHRYLHRFYCQLFMAIF